eukprot:488888-Rhodomonas_salina.1
MLPADSHDTPDEAQPWYHHAPLSLLVRGNDDPRTVIARYQYVQLCVGRHQRTATSVPAAAWRYA